VIPGPYERRELARLRAEGPVPAPYGRRELDRLVRDVSAFSGWADLLHSIEEHDYVPTVRPEDAKRRELRRALVAAKLPLYPPADVHDRGDHETALSIVCRLGIDVAPAATLEHASPALVEFVTRVLVEEGCTSSVFRMLDEGPGNDCWGGYDGLHGAWHHRLRQWRNVAPRDAFSRALGLDR